MRPPTSIVHRAVLPALLAFAVVLTGCDEIEPLLGDATSEPAAGETAPDADSGNDIETDAELGEAPDDRASDAPEEGRTSGDVGGEAGSPVSEDSRVEGADAQGAAEAEAGSAADTVDSSLLDAAADAESAGLGVDMLSSAEAAEAQRRVFEAALIGDALSAATDRDSVLASLTDEGAVGSAAAEQVSALADRPSYRVLYTQRAPDKEAGARAAEVAIYRYDIGEPVFSRVDLETGDVTSLDFPTDVPVPLVRGEIDEATLVALADPDVALRLEAAGLDPVSVGANGLLVGSTEEDNACAASRCVRLFLTTIERPVPEFSVIVDLRTLSIVEIEEMPGRSLNP